VAEVRQAELERHRSRLAGLDEGQLREVESVVNDILAKVLHQPTVALKEAAGTPRGERLVEALRSLFDL
jgi:glutamyl-tRNA reductase